MPIVDFPLSVAPGIVRSIEPHRLPPGVWSDGLNIHLRDNKTEKAFGFATFIDTPTIAPKALFFAPLNNISFWAYPGLTAIYAFDRDGTKADITGGTTPSGTDVDLWTFAYLHGFAIFNNGVNDPQQWVPGLGNNCADLSNWPASTECRTMRSFLQYLIALDVTKSSTRFAQMVKWSHGATAGAVPSSWDETDPTVDAGEVLLSSTPGIVLDCLPLGNTNILYKEDSVFGMTFIGGQLVFGFQQLFGNFGLLARDAVVAFGRKHFVVTNEDILIHNGIQATSVVDARNRKWFFDNLSEAGRPSTFCVDVRHRSEIWTFFPMTGAGIPNMIMIYNRDQQSTTFREIPAVRFASYAPAMRSLTDDSFDGSAGGSLVETIDAAAADLKGGGLVGIPITGHGLTVGATVVIAGTDNYDGSEVIVSATANEIVITHDQDAETFSTSDTVTETDTFDYESTIIFDKTEETTLEPRFFMINEDDDDIEEFDESIFQDVGVSKRSYLERQTMAFLGSDSKGKMVVDLQQMKFFTELWPHIVAADGVQVVVFFGMQDLLTDAITWHPSVIYTVGTTEVVPIFRTARFLSVRFEATGSDAWEHHGFTYEVLPLGRY